MGGRFGAGGRGREREIAAYYKSCMWITQPDCEQSLGSKSLLNRKGEGEREPGARLRSPPPELWCTHAARVSQGVSAFFIS